MKAKFISLVLLSLILNFAINEASARNSSKQVQKKLLAKQKQKISESYEKTVNVSQRNSNGIKSRGLKRSHKSWAYVDPPKIYGPMDWSKHFPHCGGSVQSPISIKRHSGQRSKKFPTFLKFKIPTGGDILYGTFENDGNSLSVKIFGETTDVKLTGGPLKGKTYSLKQFHFHFPCTEEITASEHSIEGQKYTAEAHFVFFNDRYPSYETAKNQSDGLVILALLMNIGDNGIFKGISHLKNLTNSVIEAHSSVDIGSSMSIYDFIDYDWNGYFNYAYYKGSMALPPCYESVTWIVSTEIMDIQWEDIKPWTKLKGAHLPLICNNYRPLQNSNGRPIHFFDEDE